MDQVWAWVQVAGILIQLAGISLLVFVILKTKEVPLLDLLPPDLVRGWNRAIERIHPQPAADRTAKGAMTMGSPQMRGYASVGIGPLQYETPAELTEAIRKRVNENSTALMDLRRSLDDETEARTSGEEKERIFRETEFQRLYDSLKQTKIKDTRRRLWGELAVVLFGLLLALAASVGAAWTN